MKQITNLPRLYRDYWGYLLNPDKPLSIMVCGFSIGAWALLIVATWLSFLLGDLTFWDVLFDPLITPAPLHVLHLSLFAHWAITTKDTDQ